MGMDSIEAGYVAINTRRWDERPPVSAEQVARQQWAAEPRWGLWGVPQTEVPVLPADLGGLDVIELGCGTGYVSAWAARAGARPVGIDVSANQLAVARAMQAEYGLAFPLIHGNAEQVPCPDDSFDLAVSEHGASSWCDPAVWIPEAARLLRPGGELVFLRNTTLLTLCQPDDDGLARVALQRPQRGLYRSADDEGVCFEPPASTMVRILCAAGFVITDLIDLYAPDGADTNAYGYVTGDWARRWPSEELWKARLAA